MEAKDPLISRAEIVRIHFDLLEEAMSELASARQAIKTNISLGFLFDGNLNRFAHEVSAELKIMAPDLRRIPKNSALLFACGGYTIGEKEILPYYLYRLPWLARSSLEKRLFASSQINAEGNIIMMTLRNSLTSSSVWQA